MPTATARLTVLGPIEVDKRDPGGPLARALLVALALLPAGESRSAEALADDIWGENLPKHPRAALQSLVSRVRAVCGDASVRTAPGGYAMPAPAHPLMRSDLDLAHALAERAGTDEPDDAQRLLLVQQALALWRGEVGGDLGDAPVAQQLNRAADRLRDRLDRTRARTLKALGRLDEAQEAWRALVEAHPLEEALHEKLMETLADAGSIGEALAVYAELRSRLRDEFGASPGRRIDELHTRLLREQEIASRTRVRIGVVAPPGPLIGREAEVAEVAALLRTHSLVTIIGTGGLGKTRLAQTVIAQSNDEAVVFVPLASVRTDDGVATAIAASLGISESNTSSNLVEIAKRPDLRARTLAALAEQRTLLVLDNCEQVIDGVAAWAADTLAGVAGLRILATSRTPFALAAERVFPLSPLAITVGGTTTASPVDGAVETAHLGPGGRDESTATADDDAPAVRLFALRALAVRPGAVLKRETVRRLCERLDGLPLAIELAAARVRTMTPEQIEIRLEDRFALLTIGDRAAPERHRTLQAVIEWSWDLLEEEDRASLEALSLLPGGFSAETAAGVLIAGGAAASQAEADDRLDRLVAQSLLVVSDDPATGGVRFRMLETVREFGMARLRRAGTEQTAWAAVRAWARDFVLRRAPRAFGLPGSLGPAEFRVIRAEYGNLLAAHGNALSERLHGEAVLIFGTLAQLLLVRGAHTELNRIGNESYPALLAIPSERVPEELPADAFALALTLSGIGFMTEEDPRAARVLVKLKMLAEGPAADQLRPLWRNCAEMLRGSSDPERIHGEVVRLAASPDPATRLLVAMLRGMLAENNGNADEAAEAARLAWQLSRQLEEPWIGVMAASSAAQFANQSGRPAEALEWLDRTTDDLEAFDAQDELRERNWLRGTALLALGRTSEARSIFEELTRESGQASDGREHSSIGWVGMAEAARAVGDAAASIRSFERALAEFELLGQRASPWYLMTLAAFVSSASTDASLPPYELARLASGLRSRTLATHRVQPRFADRPVLGTVLTGWASWAMTVPELRTRAVEALAFAEALGARQDLPSLNLASHFVRAVEVVGENIVGAARAAARSLSDETQVPRALEALAAPIRRR